MNKSAIALAIAIFVLGVFTGIIITDNARSASSTTAVDVPSPGNWIDNQDITVFNDKITINIKDAVKAGVKDTNSMDPLIDKDSQLIEIKPKTEQIHAGDIISFNLNSNIVVHEVMETGYDNQGWYAITKGINNKLPDPGLRRTNDVKGVVVGVLY